MLLPTLPPILSLGMSALHDWSAPDIFEIFSFHFCFIHCAYLDFTLNIQIVPLCLGLEINTGLEHCRINQRFWEELASWRAGGELCGAVTSSGCLVQGPKAWVECSYHNANLCPSHDLPPCQAVRSAGQEPQSIFAFTSLGATVVF